MFNTLKSKIQDKTICTSENTNQKIIELQKELINYQGLNTNPELSDYEEKYAKYKKHLYLTHLKNMKMRD